MNYNKIAALDLGSNTFRLLIADYSKCFLNNPKAWQLSPRIGRLLDKSSSFHPDSIKRAKESLLEYKNIIAEHNVSKVVVGATMAFRKASDGASFLANLSEEYSWPVYLLSGEEEAQLSVKGALYSLSLPAFTNTISTNNLIIDIGGGSVELTCQNGSNARNVSLPLGAVYLTEKYLKHDPPLKEELEALYAHLDETLFEMEDLLNCGQIIGVGGALTTLASMDLELTTYQAEKFNGHILKLDFLEKLVKKLAAENVEQRSKRIGLPRARADIILAGAIVAIEIVRKANQKSMMVSSGGLLEGLALWGAGAIALKLSNRIYPTTKEG